MEPILLNYIIAGRIYAYAWKGCVNECCPYYIAEKIL